MKDKSVRSGPWRLEDERPWITEGSIQFFVNNVRDTDNILEFGSGGSTIFFAKRVPKGRVVSFESGGYSVRKGNLDRSLKWYKMLIEKIKKDKIKNVELYLLQGYPNSSALYGYIIDSLPNDFNWVLIDGANRNLCIEKSRSKLVDSGNMLIDNYDHIPGAKHISDVDYFMKNEYCAVIMYELLKGWEYRKFDAKDWPGKGTIKFQRPYGWRE